MTAWYRVAAVSDLREGEAFPAELNGVAIALYRVDGEVHAVDDICTHEFAQLSQGFADERGVRRRDRQMPVRSRQPGSARLSGARRRGRYLRVCRVGWAKAHEKSRVAACFRAPLPTMCTRRFAVGKRATG